MQYPHTGDDGPVDVAAAPGASVISLLGLTDKVHISPCRVGKLVVSSSLGWSSLAPVVEVQEKG